jgi:dolichol-phosphate mannosyltransferase
MDSSQLTIEVVLVDDGSKDLTAQLMRDNALADERYHCVFLSRNHGHQLALTAGLAYARGTEAIMVIDGDLQDPPELLTSFYDYLSKGYDVIYAVRKNERKVF